MSLFNIFNISGSAMSAQSVRLNTTASNLANANSVSSSIDETYRARSPIFAAALSDASGKYHGTELTNQTQAGQSAGVKVLGVVESDKPLQIEYAPNHPMADKNGYIYRSNVNTMEEMANMISASRSYQTNVQVADTAKTMTQRLLRLGQG
ncbi:MULTISPECIES: flagellar basal body rod protein FlgC [Idiomarina]|jgi:flagellar basal-body rod protein FlgC|uniref:Flagellar basal-body rod protein FlgC n=2 Tax=Idiomarina baltica TaxID=190892 RepID=A0A348WQ01_9GAMM|nr:MULTISPECIES: flagellar basal body rod protein FlgC [Idiomarina]MAF74790.1 flagellar basal body rod protein FlgC [Idiomarinaceae bacterium]MEC8926098.1 flagellar basal body rod protein FlgC [Pseudomonadota bacterium]EAQ31826.1 Flagellar basal body rod protein [Idiomarina baltica OS145]KXS35222.1 MAG: flagellar basal body rod protein [Idiomarina sp. T82-3]MBR38470.1 flagellar basal body rod protein FlgC [Idiomarina sp.]|tara:strand:+ start:1298 stop:1750 length:453 start_codon:yes stop_codon:yes gene_type:complete